MCCILVRDIEKHEGCIAFKIEPGSQLVRLKNRLEKITKTNINIEVVFVSSPKMYGEYKPYKFVSSKRKIIKAAKNLVNQ